MLKPIFWLGQSLSVASHTEVASAVNVTEPQAANGIGGVGWAQRFF